MRILLDTDASIKLTKKNLPDAIRMEKLIQEGKITVSKVIGQSSVENSRLGAGEKSVLDYYLANDMDLIVSDDEAFLKMLDIYEIPY